MAKKTAVIGTDIGTTSTKSVAFDLEGNVIASHHVAYPIISPKSNFQEQYPDVIFEAVVETIKTVVQKVDRDILGVGLSAAMHSLILMDKDDKPITNSIIWADNRSVNQAEKLKRGETGKQIYNATGTPIHPMSPLPKILWFKENQPDLFKKAQKFISIKEYVWFHLFGEYVVDHSIASATGLFNIFKLRWEREALSCISISPKQLSEPVPTTYQKLKEDNLDLLNLPKPTPFVIGASDGCLANLGSGAIKKGEVALTIGTSGAIRMVSSKPKTDKVQSTFSYVLSEKHFVIGGAINNGGIINQWFKDHILELESWDTAYQKVENIPAGSNGLVCLPYFLGERAPHWNANAKGAFIGVSYEHSKEHFYRATLEGIIFSLLEIGQIIENQASSIKNVYANGGFAQSSTWLQMVADIFQKKVILTNTKESAAFGAAMLALYALGNFENLEDSKKLVINTKEIIPNSKNKEVYQNNFKIFKGIYHSLRGILS